MSCLFSLEALLGWNIGKVIAYLVGGVFLGLNIGQSFTLVLARCSSLNEYRSNYKIFGGALLGRNTGQDNTYTITGKRFLKEIRVKLLHIWSVRMRLERWVTLLRLCSPGGSPYEKYDPVFKSNLF